MNDSGTPPLVVANHGDFIGQSMDARFHADELKIWYSGSAALLDHALFWATGDALAVVTDEVHPELLADVRAFFGAKAIEVLRPGGDGFDLCERVSRDQEASARVKRHLSQAEAPLVLAWGMTASLAAFLRQQADGGLHFRAPTIPSPEVLWLVDLLDSKPGFRLLAEDLSREHAQVRVPEGLILPDLDAALAAAQEHFFGAGHSVVLKAARGTGGYSTLVCIHSKDPGEQELLFRRARSLARFDTFWKTGSVVVERFIPGPDGGAPTAFTVDACVHQDGTVSVECLGRMLIQDGKRYDGAVIGKGAVDPQLATQLRDVAGIFGRALAQRGFTGLFDLDLVVDKDGHAWVCEMNVRRASPSHLQSIAHRAFGSSWATRGAVFGRDYVYVQGSLKLTYKDIKEMAAKFRSSSPALLCLLITQASRSLLRRSPYFGYAIVADDALTCAQEAGRFERFVYASLGLNLGALSASRKS